MIKILKRIRFIFSIALYIPISLVSGIIWLASSIVVTIINSLIIIPIEYIITGDIKFGKKIHNNLFKSFPEYYDQASYDFFREIYP